MVNIDIPKANVMCPNTNNLLTDFVVQLRLQRYAMVRAAKGKKDRVLPLPQTLLQNLRQYYLAYRPKDYFLKSNMAEDIPQKVFRILLKNMPETPIFKNQLLRTCYAIRILPINLKTALVLDMCKTY